MQKLKFKEIPNVYSRDTWWNCNSCGKELNFTTSVPYRCPKCSANLPNVHMLAPKGNQDNRVKYFMTGKL